MCTCVNVQSVSCFCVLVAGLSSESVWIIEAFQRNINSRTTAAEIVLKHWQFCYNEYGVNADRCPRPCTRDELVRLLRVMERHDLIDDILSSPSLSAQLAKSKRQPEENLTFDQHSCYSSSDSAVVASAAQSRAGEQPSQQAVAGATLDETAFKPLMSPDATNCDNNARDNARQRHVPITDVSTSSDSGLGTSRDSQTTAASTNPGTNVEPSSVAAQTAPSRGNKVAPVPQQNDSTELKSVVDSSNVERSAQPASTVTTRPKPTLPAKPARFKFVTSQSQPRVTCEQPQPEATLPVPEHPAMTSVSNPGYVSQDAEARNDSAPPAQTTPQVTSAVARPDVAAKRPSSLDVTPLAATFIYVPNVVMRATGDDVTSVGGRQRAPKLRLSIAKDSEETYL